jgi:hypothetical protein
LKNNYIILNDKIKQNLELKKKEEKRNQGGNKKIWNLNKLQNWVWSLMKLGTKW